MTATSHNTAHTAGQQAKVDQPKVDHQQQIQQRQLARQLAVQALFEVDSVGHKPGDVVDARLANPMPSDNGDDPQVALGPETGDYLRWLVSGVITNRQTIDRIIAKYAPEWPVDQLAIIDRNVLRLAIFELGSRDADTPCQGRDQRGG